MHHDRDDEKRLNRTQSAFVNWYRCRASDRLARLVEQWWPLLGSGGIPPRLILDQRLRWGSCAPDGTLRLNWRIVMLPKKLKENFVVHDLAYLWAKNYSADFRETETRTLPDDQQRRRDV